MGDGFVHQKIFGNFLNSQPAKYTHQSFDCSCIFRTCNKYYNDDQNISDVVDDELNTRTMLTEFFEIYRRGDEPNQYLYSEIPKYYWWDKKERTWHKRNKALKVIGRIYPASPREGERFYERMLLNDVRGPDSFDFLLTVNNVRCNTFREAAEKRGILEEDDSLRQCLIEARTEKMPDAFQRLFATILIFCEPTGVRRLWDENYCAMIEYYPGSSDPNNVYVKNRLLYALNKLLQQHGKTLQDFDLPQISQEFRNMDMTSNLIEEELAIPISENDLNSAAALNVGQMHAFNTIRNAISSKRNTLFFVDGPGGTGKTFLYRALLASCRKDGLIILVMATSGIAATQLPGGRTSHSRLKIPIKLHSKSVCNFSKQSDLAKLVAHSSAIILDEVPMANKDAIETVDRTFRDIFGVDLPFGGKIMIFNGYFRQVVPVVVNGTRAQSVRASFVESELWEFLEVLKLVDNIRALHDQEYAKLILRVGNRDEQTIADNMIRIPESMVVPWENDSSVEQLVASTFPDLESHLYDAVYMTNRAIITPLNKDVNKLNDTVLKLLSSHNEVSYHSFDSVVDDSKNLFLPKYLNSLNPGTLPPHTLTLKKGCPIILLCNLDPKGTRVFLPRVPLKTSEDAKLPFEMIRKQFPVRLNFALTINKSQGQTIPHVGIFLPDDVFSHGQLYVALSRGISEATTKVLIKRGNVDGVQGVFTKNIVYKELFTKLDYN